MARSIMTKLASLEHLLAQLQARIFTPVDCSIPLRFRRALDEERGVAVADDRSAWDAVDPDLIWGEPDGYFWFGGSVTLPQEVSGKRVFLHIEAQFGNVMGRSDPQLLVRINGKLAQGSDANHRELLLCEDAKPGDTFDILIEAGTIEDRRQTGFACSLMLHDPMAEDLFYDLRVPFEVASLLAEDDPRRSFMLNVISDALQAVDLRPGDRSRFEASLAEAKCIAQRIYDAEDFGEKPVITVTGHTHIDVAWLWRVRETRQKMARSMTTALALMDQYPDYKFMYNQGLLLDYLQNDYPELFDRIKLKQQEGQFEIEGALWLEPDANITSGESFVRHIMHGVAYHESQFGVSPKLMWLPDTFGYSAALPQIMERSGLEAFITHKMSWNDTNRMPYETFHWQGIDGTRVPAYFLTTQPYTSNSINTTYCPNLKATHVMGTWRRHGQQDLNNELFLVYGHGDGGGGPTREMLEHIRRMEKGIPGCPAVVHGTMGGFFDGLIDRMKANPDAYPTWVGELYLEFHRGTLTSVAKNKRNNRLAEQSLRDLEALASLAMVKVGFAYPSEQLHALWQIVMLNQFHDILPGSSIGSVYDDSDRDYALFFDKADALKTELVGALAGDGAILLNPLGRVRSGLVRVAGQSPQKITVNGEAISSQAICHADGTIEQVAPISRLAAMSAQPVKVVDGEAALGDGGLSVSTQLLENSHLAVRFDQNGRISSILDKPSGREIGKAGALLNRLQAYRDFPPQFDAWDIDASFEDKVWDIDELVRAEVVEEGPYRAAVRFEWRYESSKIVQVLSLEADARQIEIDCYIDWHEHNTLVKAAFPVEVKAFETTAEIQFGHVKRPTHQNTSWDQARFETVMHRWVDISEPDFGVALLNDCKYGYDAKDTTIRLTMLRSPTWPWPDADQGTHHMRYGLVVHDGLFDGEGVPAKAEAFNMPLRIMQGQGKSGADLKQDRGLIGIDLSNVTVEAIKKAEADDALIIRLWETEGHASKAVLSLNDVIVSLEEVDLLERPLADAVRTTESSVSLAFKPFEIRTFKLVWAGTGTI